MSRYWSLKPNCDASSMPDTAAVNSLDRFQTAFWFLSRGDQCLNCEGVYGFWESGGELTLKIRKGTGPCAQANQSNTDLKPDMAAPTRVLPLLNRVRQAHTEAFAISPHSSDRLARP